MDPVRAWIEGSPYAASLGVCAEEVGEERVRLALPYADSNSNADKALHGGVSASLIALAGQAVARAALGADSGPWHTAAVQVSYLAAALSEEIRAEARLLRRGKELAYADVEVQSVSGKLIAKGLVQVHGRFGAAPVELPEARSDPGGTDRGPLGAMMGRLPFHAKLGLAVEHMAGGRARLVLPWKDTNADAGGGVHEGAVLALLDTTGAMASWAETGPGRFKASTPGLQARFLAPTGPGDLVAYGSVLHRDRELLFAQVEIVRADDRRLVAHGTVNYRIVTPDTAR
jgi:uncharacterized protein (TIGR00369 family)